MRRSTAKVGKLAGALGAVLALPLSFAVAPDVHADARASNLAEFAQSASVLDAWRDYALADLTLDFSWARDSATPLSAPTLFDRGIARIGPASHFAAAGAAASALSVTFSKTKAADTPLFVQGDTPSLLQDYTPGLQRYLLTPSYSQRWGDHSFINVSAIFAYQRFASLGLGVDSLPVTGEPSLATAPFARNDPGSYGSGMRVGLSSLLSDDLSWEVGYQSRVNMDVFNNYRGVYSELGSFDIPASANVSMAYAVSPDLKLDVSAERVMYSQVAPFTSSAMPTKFLALFGSQVSPTLAWENLDVYSVGWTWRDPSDGFWSLHYSTREQPLPADQRLQIALEPYLSSHDVQFGFAHMFGPLSSLHIAATYAPTAFMLGVPTSNSWRNAEGNQIEYQALWTTRF
jgi:hypothetical protein